jgi:hypothetical protein
MSFFTALPPINTVRCQTSWKLLVVPQARIFRALVSVMRSESTGADVKWAEQQVDKITRAARGVWC